MILQTFPVPVLKQATPSGGEQIAKAFGTKEPPPNGCLVCTLTFAGAVLIGALWLGKGVV